LPFGTNLAEIRSWPLSPGLGRLLNKARTGATILSQPHRNLLDAALAIRYRALQRTMTIQ